MGRRKELLEWEGRPLILHQVDAVRRAGLPCLLVCNEVEELPRELFADTCVQVVRDSGVSCGPITGIVTAMQTRTEEVLLILSCDLPFLQADHLVKMIRHLPDLQESDAVIAQTDGRLHPLFALYHRRTQPLWEQALQEQSYRVMAVVEKMRAIPIQEEWLMDGATFNMNTPQEYETALEERRRIDALSKRDRHG